MGRREKELLREGKRKPDFEVKEPYASDVSEGKTNPVYTAHTYHTKVPHPAIMRYILHYTQPGDVVFDGFAGTGMTGVAAQACGVRSTVYSTKLQMSGKQCFIQHLNGELGMQFVATFRRTPQICLSVIIHLLMSKYYRKRLIGLQKS